MKAGQRPVTVIGSSEASPPELQAAQTVGQLLARQGCALITGGRGGVMQAVARSHRDAGGFSIGILPGIDTSDSNPYSSLNIPTGIGMARNMSNVLAGHATIVVGGRAGTMSELAYALLFLRPILMLSYLAGASALPLSSLTSIQPRADITVLESETDLPDVLAAWLQRIFG